MQTEQGLFDRAIAAWNSRDSAEDLKDRISLKHEVERILGIIVPEIPSGNCILIGMPHDPPSGMTPQECYVSFVWKAEHPSRDKRLVASAGYINAVNGPGDIGEYSIRTLADLGSMLDDWKMAAYDTDKWE